MGITGIFKRLADYLTVADYARAKESAAERVSGGPHMNRARLEAMGREADRALARLSQHLWRNH